MSKKIKRLLFSISVFIGILLLSNLSNAASLRLRDLDYQVTLNEDGSADIIENWRIRIEDTNTLFKTFEIDSSKYKEITDVKVSEVKNGKNIPFTKINEELYHVNKNCYYALKNSKGKFEIAWGAHAEDVTKNYQISYKVIDAVKNYSDCSEFYWQFVSTQSDIPADKVTGTVVLPTIISEESSRIWAHGPLNGNVFFKNGVVKFEVSRLEKNTMLEVRVVTPTNLFPNNKNVSKVAKLNTIIEQEQEWADEANKIREEKIKEKERQEKIRKLLPWIGGIISIILVIFMIIKMIKYHKILKENPVIKPDQKLDYYRDIPDETATPAEAGFLYYFNQQNMQAQIPKIFSATMLDLCMKGYLTFEAVEDKKNEIKVTVKEKEGKPLEDEQAVYDLLLKVANKEDPETKTFTMKQFNKYISSSTVMSTLSISIENRAKEKQEEKQNYNAAVVKKATNWSSIGVLYLMGGMFSIFMFFMMFIAIIPFFICSIYCFKIASRYRQLTQKGVNEKEKWVGLKKYMEEFSMIEDKTVPELVLWEKYLVFASVFGIADKVLKQLKVVYPEITDIDYMTNHGYTYLYLMYAGSFRGSFITSLNNSVQSSFTSSTNYSNYSSGGGLGGGFSGGGGFGGGGGRNGRKINEIKNNQLE